MSEMATVNGKTVTIGTKQSLADLDAALSHADEDDDYEWLFGEDDLDDLDEEDADDEPEEKSGGISIEVKQVAMRISDGGVPAKKGTTKKTTVKARRSRPKPPAPKKPTASKAPAKKPSFVKDSPPKSGSTPKKKSRAQSGWDESRVKRDATGKFAFKRGSGQDGNKNDQEGVKQLQRRLIAEGFLNTRDGRGGNAVDGLFGPKTEAAVKAWQKKNGHEPTGVLSGSRLKALSKPVARRNRDNEAGKKAPAPVSLSKMTSVPPKVKGKIRAPVSVGEEEWDKNPDAADKMKAALEKDGWKGDSTDKREMLYPPEHFDAAKRQTKSLVAEDDDEDDDYIDPEVKAMVDSIPRWELLMETKAGSKNPNAARLRRYWTRGEGALKVKWGTPGDFKRCVRQVRKYVGPMAEGMCSNYHQTALGARPGKGPHVGIKSEVVYYLEEEDLDEIRSVIDDSAVD